MSSTESVDEIKAIFWRIMLDDFPCLETAIQALERPCLRVFEKGAQREFNRACARFLEENAGVGWPRYDAYLKYWKQDDPRIPEFEDGEVVGGADFREAGELLAHRIVMAFYEDRRLRRYLAETDAFPYWRLRVINDGRTPPDCLAEANTTHHFRDAYWQTKTLPCERLFCRCSISRDTAIKP